MRKTAAEAPSAPLAIGGLETVGCGVEVLVQPAKEKDRKRLASSMTGKGKIRFETTTRRGIASKSLSGFENPVRI
jgi:hypothetical protein